jgi:hypothetical protein
MPNLSIFAPVMPNFSAYVKLCQFIYFFLSFPQVFPTHAKTIRLFSLMPKLSSFARVMSKLSAYVQFCQFINFCSTYAKIINFFRVIPNLSHSI